MKTLLALLVGLAIAVALTPRDNDEAAGFPRKPITLIVAYSPGGAVDTVARTMARYIEPYLGQRIVVRNKPGAGGEIGYRSLATANNDGYTIGMITAPPILMLNMLRDSDGADINAFETIGSVQKDPVVLAVESGSQFKTLNELLEHMRDNSAAKVNVAGDGPFSNNHLQLVVTEHLLDVDFNFVPFSGSAPSITALMGGQVQAAVPSASSVTNYVRRGDVRVLAVFSPERYAYLPDAPTIHEASGVDVPDVGAAVRGLVVPKGLPEAEKQILDNAFQKLMNDEQFLQHAEHVALPIHHMDAKEFDQYLEDMKSSLQTYVPLLSE